MTGESALRRILSLTGTVTRLVFRVLHLKVSQKAEENSRTKRPPGCGFSGICLFGLASCEVVVAVGSCLLELCLLVQWLSASALHSGRLAPFLSSGVKAGGVHRLEMS